jgi:RNA polymerase sigma-70 factor (ECF subfamily)
MDPSVREELEGDVHRLCDAGDHAAAASAALRGYGGEVYGLICALHHDAADADDVFAMFSETLWRGLPGFAWQCTLRTWAYTLARHASHRFGRELKKRRRGVPLGSSSLGPELEQQVRSVTQAYLRTEVKDRFAQLRESLPPEDQLLLVLRVDRRLEWIELARVMCEDETPDDAALAREAARLRKRFQLLKAKLVKLAEEAGIRSGEG